MGTIVGLVFPDKEKKQPSNSGKVITITTKGGKKKAEKTKEDKEFEEKEK